MELPLPPVTTTGTARVAGHLGEFLQGRLGPQGPLALVTLPCTAFAAEAEVRPGRLSLYQGDAKLIDRQGLRRFLGAAGLRERGRFRLTVEMPPGAGAGASTAARVALARAAGAQDPWRIARACLSSEGASDPLMFDAPERLLWASREARALAALPPLPAMEVIGGFLGPPCRTDPADLRFPDVADLVEDWCRGGDLGRLAALATASAERCLALRGPADTRTPALAAQLGAAGWAIAHTGSARALLFAPGTVPAGAVPLLEEAGLTRVLRFRLGAH